mmetsp:Transcript_133146/g.231385  ORF Transcript_133146/g.231385 Transcript_133146/m.231385 type:complete len:315 (+) Transcript_133146:126-1070(+)
MSLFDNSVALSGGVLCLALIGILAIISLGAVPPLHYGIKYNSFTKSADTDALYEPGRYPIGPWNSFLLFPSNVHTIEFTNEPRLKRAGTRYEPLHTRTKEGLGLYLQVSLQYRLVKEKVGALYSEFNMNYETVFLSSLRDVLIKAASEYEAAQLWGERDEFGNNMQEMVNLELNKMYAECWGLQLMIIDLPDMFEDSIVHTQVQKQAVRTRQNEQISTQIHAETTVIEAEYGRQVKVILAEGQANYTYTTKMAQAKAQKKRIDTESDVLGDVRKELDLDSEGLVLYQKYNALDDLSEAGVFYGFEEGSKVLVQA